HAAGEVVQWDLLAQARGGSALPGGGYDLWPRGQDDFIRAVPRGDAKRGPLHLPAGAGLSRWQADGGACDPPKKPRKPESTGDRAAKDAGATRRDRFRPTRNPGRARSRGKAPANGKAPTPAESSADRGGDAGGK